MSDGLVVLSLALCVHSPFVFFERCLREVFIVICRIDKVGVASGGPRSQRIVFVHVLAGAQGDQNQGIWIYVGVYIHSFVNGDVGLVIDDDIVFAAGKVEEIKVPLGIGIRASHCSTAVLQFDEDPASGSIAFENSKLS